MCYLPTFNTVECIWQPLWAVGTKLNVLPELRLHDTKWPLIIIVAVWFVFSSPYFLQNKVPYPSKYQVTFFSPWSYYPEFAGPVKNNAMPDVIDQIYPWKYFTIQSLKNGQIPLWNPYSFAGNPHIANFQSAVFSPFNLILFLQPFYFAWSIFIFIAPFLAAFFNYLFLRELKLSKRVVFTFIRLPGLAYWIPIFCFRFFIPRAFRRRATIAATTAIRNSIACSNRAELRTTNRNGNRFTPGRKNFSPEIFPTCRSGGGRM